MKVSFRLDKGYDPRLMTIPSQAEHTPKPSSTRNLIFNVLIMRIVMDTGTKLFFPYLSVIATGLGTTTVELGKLLSWRNMAGLISPFLGTAADKRGYRPIISGSLVVSGIGFLTIYLSQSPPIFLLGILLSAVGGAGAGPNIAAYLSHRLPWEKRARGLGVVEYAWGLASVIGVSASGYLIAQTSWRMPFLVVGLALFLFAAAFMRFPPSGHEKSKAELDEIALGNAKLSLAQKARNFFDLGPNWRSAWATILGDIFTRFAGFVLFINFGTMLVDQFGLDAAGLAGAVFWLGFADITGSVSVSLLGDRIGKRQSTIGGSIMGAIFFGILPFWSGGLAFVVLGIFLARSFFEFSIVSYLVLASEQAPGHRGKMLALRGAFSLISAFASTRLGPQLYEAWGVPGFAWPAAISLVISATVSFFLVRD